MNKADLLFVAVHRGLVGAAVNRELPKQSFDNLLLKSRFKVDHVVESEVSAFFESEKLQSSLTRWQKSVGI